MALTTLQAEWNTLYRTTLPQLAKARSKAQPTWPVRLDHCFARIILDNAIGIDKPWAAVLKAPAYKNMNEEQLRTAIELGMRIKNGEVNLCELDQRSLMLRGKSKGRGGSGQAGKVSPVSWVETKDKDSIAGRSKEGKEAASSAAATKRKRPEDAIVATASKRRTIRDMLVKNPKAGS